jgi:hypothetical protein
MILRSIAAPLANSEAVVPAWKAVEASQRLSASEWWLITQPAHAALAGEMAAQFDSQLFPRLDTDVVRAISLHDAGWGPYDAAVIQPLASGKSGSRKQTAPYSFIDAPVAETIAAWTGSIDTAAKLSALGGLLVSLHFCSIAQIKPETSGEGQRAMEQFLKTQYARQQAWRKKSGPAGDDERVLPLLQVLQLCDLLSLYLACGLTATVEFPQSIKGRAVRLSRSEGGVRLEPSPFRSEHLFSISGLRYPRRPGEPNSASFALQMD